MQALQKHASSVLASFEAIQETGFEAGSVAPRLGIHTSAIPLAPTGPLGVLQKSEHLNDAKK